MGGENARNEKETKDQITKSPNHQITKSPNHSHHSPERRTHSARMLGLKPPRGKEPGYCSVNWAKLKNRATGNVLSG
jgi:hypothetical protein